MKFPITREKLQNFDYAESIMEKANEEINKKFDVLLENLTKEFTRQIQHLIREKKIVWHELSNINNIIGIHYSDIQRSNEYKNNNNNNHTSTFHNHNNRDIIFEQYREIFMKKIQELFIGCDIIVDPLKTYIIIDWS
jgi:hypothetical protein